MTFAMAAILSKSLIQNHLGQLFLHTLYRQLNQLSNMGNLNPRERLNQLAQILLQQGVVQGKRGACGLSGLPQAMPCNPTKLSQKASESVESFESFKEISISSFTISFFDHKAINQYGSMAPTINPIKIFGVKTSTVSIPALLTKASKQSKRNKSS